ncbi:MAG: hypothetical protein HOI47_03060 [Candidatus Scalindua sp.]|jgi:hypothetical protein|nr:hypothetical protein [Candidatus Scalindua sp.]MBT6225620.1 hypothetical protein [Candidatus Scalindua sp.]
MSIDLSKFKNIKFDRRTSCKVCSQISDDPLFDLPGFPMTEIYVDCEVNERLGFVDQFFHFCGKCGHGQIANVIDVELQYGESEQFYFRASQSATGRESADFFIEFLNRVVKKRHLKTIVEVGCNDMYILNALKSRADKLIGIDPILKDKQEEYTKGNIIAIGDFLENVQLKDGMDIVLCKDTLEHVSEPRQFVKKIVDNADNADNEPIFVFQFPLLETLLSGCRFDQVFHQHLNYFSLQSIIYMLEDLGCQLLDYTINENHWGMILIAFRKSKNKSEYAGKFTKITSSQVLESYKVFKDNMCVTNDRLNLLKGEKIYGYGAALMLPALSYYLGNDFSSFECILDDDKNKTGLSYINLPVTIRTTENINDIQDSIVLVTAISAKNNVRNILVKLAELNPKQIIVPMATF